MSGSHISIQYKAENGLFGCLVINNTKEDKEDAEALMQKLLGVKKGQLSFGPEGTVGETLAYNQGYGAGMAAANANTSIVDAPDLLDPINGEILIKGNPVRSDNPITRPNKKKSRK